MQNIGKFRTWGGKIILKNDLAQFLTRFIAHESNKIDVDVIKNVLSQMENDFVPGSEYEIEVNYDGEDLITEKKPIWLENEDKLHQGETLEFNNDDAPIKFKNVFWLKKDGYLYVYEGLVDDLLAVYAEKVLRQSLPVKEEKFDLVDVNACFANTEEAFKVTLDGGVQSINRVGNIPIGNSRFYAKYLRNAFNEG